MNKLITSNSHTRLFHILKFLPRLHGNKLYVKIACVWGRCLLADESSTEDTTRVCIVPCGSAEGGGEDCFGDRVIVRSR